MNMIFGRSCIFSGILISLISISTETVAVTLHPISGTWLELQNEPTQVKVSPDGHKIAYVESQSPQTLKMVDIRTRKSLTISTAAATDGYFWSPDSSRVFYRRLGNATAPQAQLDVFTIATEKSQVVATLDKSSGPITLDPRDNRVHTLTEKGIVTQQLLYPDSRLAKWQANKQDRSGYWLASQGGMLWVTNGSRTMRRIPDDGAALAAFSISPDGSAAAWSTTNGQLFMSRGGEAPTPLGDGIAPAWHPERAMVVYASPRWTVDKIVDYDLKIADFNGLSKFITATSAIAERSPSFLPDGRSVIFAKSGSQELGRLEIIE